jgi:hypothetical protein
MKRWIGVVTLAAVAVLAVGCDDGIGDQEIVDDGALRADAALVAADAMFEDLAFMQAPPILALPGMFPNLAGSEAPGNVTFSRQVSFYDADGNLQDRYDPLLTASIKVEWGLSRSVEHAFWSASVQRQREMMVTGLLGMETERTWNGTGTGVVARSRHPEEGITRTYDMSSEVVIANVVRGVPRSEHPYPLRGSITRHMEVVVTKDGQVVAERDVTAVITFNGTQFATVTVGPDSWEVDLSQGRLKGIFKKKRG